MGSALEVALCACGLAALACWALSLATSECSWVDRWWSIAPPLYAIYAAWASGWHPRLVLMAALVTAWGARLTFNFARKGGYAKGGEDYRWGELRNRMGRAQFQLLNVVFIAGFQNLILLGIVLPSYVALDHLDVPLNAIDAVAAILFLSALVLETAADEQQWRFHQDKRERRERGEPIQSGFLTEGLFRYSRHPNFFAEQAMWWAFCLFSIAAGAPWLHWSFAGALVLTLLFQGSTRFTEELSLAKYPSYAKYQRSTSRLIPLPPKRA